MATVRLIGQNGMNMILKDLPGVKAAVYSHAETIAAKAAANLARHSSIPPNASIIVRRGDVDSYVILDDPAAMSIEFGHWYTNGRGSPTYVPGLYVLTRAAGII